MQHPVASALRIATTARAPKTNVELNVRILFRFWGGGNHVGRGECVRVVEKRQQDPGQLLCVSQNACQWRIFLAWDMQTWTKNEFTIQKAENRRSGYFQILWAAVCFFFSYEFVGSVPVALLAIFMHLSWLLRAFNFAQKTIQFVSKLCRQEMEKWLAFLNGNRNDKVH